MPGRGVLGFFPRRWNGREPWLAQPGPHFLGRNGGKNPRGKRFFPLDSLLWWDWVGGGCTSYGIPGLRPSQRKVRNGPPTGWAGWGCEWVPFGRRQRVTVRVSTFPPDNKPLLPPARAGGRAMRRWSWRPQARPLPDGTTFPRSSHQRMGFQGEGTSFPLVFFPLFLQRNRAPPGRAPFPPVPTAQKSPQETGSRREIPPRRLLPFLSLC